MLPYRQFHSHLTLGAFPSQSWPFFESITTYWLLPQRSTRRRPDPVDLDETVMESGVINKLLIYQSLIRLMAPHTHTHMHVKHTLPQRPLLRQVLHTQIYASLSIHVDFNNGYVICVQGWMAGV